MLVPFAIVLALVFGAFHHLLEEVSYADIVVSVQGTSAQQLWLALLATCASYLALTGYDASSLRYVGAKLPYPQVAITSFIAFALGNNVGIGPLTGGAVRMRVYSAAKVEPALILRAIAFNAVAFGFGLAAIGALGLWVGGAQVAGVLHVPTGGLRGLAVLVLAGVVAIVAACFWKRELLIRGCLRLLLPSGWLALFQLLVSCAEIVAASLVLWALLPHESISYPTFLACYAIALVAGVISHMPGGLGVFEAVLLVGVGDAVPRDTLAAALVLYRCIYFLLPLALSVMLLSGMELRKVSATPAVRALSRLSPMFLAAFILAVAVMLLISGSLPASDGAMALLELSIPLPLVEAAHLASSLAGLALLFVVRGILLRLDVAWWLALLITVGAFILSLPKGVSLIEMGILAYLAGMLILSRREFTRASSLLRQRFGFEWWFLVAMVLAITLWMLFFAYRDVDYARELWWQFEFDGNAPRSMRAAFALLLIGASVALTQMLRPAPVILAGPSVAEMANAAKIVRAQPNAENGLAMMGDKHFIFSESGKSFLMFGVHNDSLVALFDPVGLASECGELVWKFREFADQRGVRAAFYQVRPSTLPRYLDAGFRVYKLGEYGWVNLSDFSLQGPKRANLRHGCSRAERQGLKVEIIPAEQTCEYLPVLREISDAWLHSLHLNEKGFSLGAFSEDYLAQQPVALIRHGERVIGFASLLETNAQDEASVDLMRYLPDAPPNTMEYLFVQVILHLKTQGFKRFGLGMAPLSGMEDHPLAPTWHRVARIIFSRGENFYNFQGLRSFKEKFSPEWEPRYLAANGGVNAIRISLDIVALVSGGLRKAVLK
ncbi:conserved hypothetical protein [gamma proteobacterium HdN1]|nr:conserved hypothetical protein [gamma proteobacterium HdN1]